MHLPQNNTQLLSQKKTHIFKKKKKVCRKTAQKYLLNPSYKLSQIRQVLKKKRVPFSTTFQTPFSSVTKDPSFYYVKNTQKINNKLSNSMAYHRGQKEISALPAKGITKTYCPRKTNVLLKFVGSLLNELN